MYKEVWVTVQPSVCSLTFFYNEYRLSSGSGFKVGDKLITNNHVLQVPSATHVAVQFVADDGHSLTAERTFTIIEFKKRLLDGEPKDSWDYAILDLALPEFTSIPSLELAITDDNPIGSAIALFGFHFEQTNLAMHTGIIASKFVHAGVPYLQLDASVNAGNSGGPVVRPDTGEVIGIVTRKATGLTTQFDLLRQSFSYWLDRYTLFGDLPFVEQVESHTLVTVQTQLQAFANEINRSANVGIGYAYELARVRHNISLLD